MNSSMSQKEKEDLQYKEFIHYMMFTPTAKLPAPPTPSEQYLELGIQIKELLQNKTITIDKMNSNGYLKLHCSV